MGKGRLEAFSDGVVAIIITIMVLELKVPHGTGWETLVPLAPTLGSYALSFVFVGIYWNNHHHLLHAARTIDGRILWANLHLLFWLSLTPFTTGWMGENHFAAVPVAIYGVDLLACALAYTILVRVIIAGHGPQSALAKAVGSDRKGNISLAAYSLAIAVATFNPWISCALYAAVALMWLVPDRRISKVLG